MNYGVKGTFYITKSGKNKQWLKVAKLASRTHQRTWTVSCTCKWMVRKWQPAWAPSTSPPRFIASKLPKIVPSDTFSFDICLHAGTFGPPLGGRGIAAKHNGRGEVNLAGGR